MCLIFENIYIDDSKLVKDSYCDPIHKLQVEKFPYEVIPNIVIFNSSNVLKHGIKYV